MRNNAISSIDQSRAKLAAAVAGASMLWGGYAELHNEVLTANGRQPWQVVTNAEDKSKRTIVHLATNRLHDSVRHSLAVNAGSTLRHEDFLVIQDMLTAVRRKNLNGINDLRNAGLTFPVDISKQIIGTENVSEFTAATQEMNPSGYTNNSIIFSEIHVPNPITHLSYEIPFRNTGFQYLGSLGLSESMRQVAERLELTLFKGNPEISVNFNGAPQTIYGYTNHPNAGTGVISDWSDEANVEKIPNEVINLVNKIWADQGGVEGDSVVLYFPANFKAALSKDYKAFGDKTVIARLLEIPEISAVRYGNKLEDGEIVLVEMSARTIQLGIASDMITVPHTKVNPLDPVMMTTYAAMVQVIKVDSNGNTGILHATVA